MGTFFWLLCSYYIISGLVAALLCWMAIPAMWIQVPWRRLLIVLIPFIGFWFFFAFWTLSFMEYFGSLYERETDGSSTQDTSDHA